MTNDEIDEITRQIDGTGPVLNRAIFRAGMEHAAKICDSKSESAKKKADHPDTAFGHGLVVESWAFMSCASAIRAAANAKD